MKEPGQVFVWPRDRPRRRAGAAKGGLEEAVTRERGGLHARESGREFSPSRPVQTSIRARPSAFDAVTETTETLEYGAQVQELLDLVIHSLYTQPEIFLRELVSNASDALDKLRFLALTDPALLGDDDELAIELVADAAERTLEVRDNGVGMNRADLVGNLGTIASSGTRRFLEELRAGDPKNLPELIGQFGVGFYACFMVAELVTVETRKAGEEQGWRFRSRADGKYEIEPAEGVARGTRVVLKLKERGEDDQDFTDAATLRALVKRYSDFVEHPIRLEGKTINSLKPLWARPKAEIGKEEYDQFYRHLTHDWHDPLEVIHFKAEGTSEYTALLFVPPERPFAFFDAGASKPQVSLYVKRVFITSDCPDLLPGWLRFVRGVVEASDLPLNVSREVLQANPHVRAIKKRLTRKVLESLAELRERDAAAYASFWKEFGAVLKEGICVGEDEDQRIAKLCLFETSAGAEATTLEGYVARMKEGQEAIWFITGKGRATVDGSPHLELLRAKGQEVLYFLEPVDEWMIDGLREFEGKKLKSVHGADVELASEEERGRVERAQKEAKKFLAALGEHFGESVKEVRFSARLIESPGLLVTEEGALRPNMERMMREARHGGGARPRILELNPDHPLIVRMREMHGRKGEEGKVMEYADLLYGQALLAEGSALPDPARFSRLVAELMVKAG